MGYYMVRLDFSSQKLCTIITPWGKYQYQRLPMGVNVSPDVFQEKMSELMEGLEFVRTYLDVLEEWEASPFSTSVFIVIMWVSVI